MPALDFILAYARWFVLICVDLWIDCNNRYRNWQKSRACAYAHAAITRLNTQSTHLIAAYACNDITPAMKAFYHYNEVLSRYRMETWMQKCGQADTKKIHIYTMRDGIIYHSHVDLDNDNELLTGQPFDDLAIELLPSVAMQDEPIVTKIKDE
jgi:hypothetical protein